jgi:tripartite-type tricarboxylate transporter receptor subunit TctC
VEKLNAVMQAALEKPEVKEQLLAQGAVPDGGSSEAFAKFVQAEHDKWAQVIQDAGITIE